MMKTVTYEGDGLNVIIELGMPTIMTGVLEALAFDCLRGYAKTGVSLGHVITFSKMLKYTRSIVGVSFTLPKWNATTEEMLTVFEAWLSLPEALGDRWYEGVESLTDATPLLQTPNASQNIDEPPLTMQPLPTESEKPKQSATKK
jgi:hypothetical protein